MRELEKDEYRTIKSESRGLYKEKGSKFIAVAVPVKNLDEVRETLESLRKEFHDARHHCYAYRLGPEPYEYRQNDDGEPSGSAGKPIYGQIQSFELTDILIVVIRYFGGVKLGVGGLINAYRTASRDALEHARIIIKTRMSEMQIDFNYEQMNTVMRLIKEENLEISGQDFGLKCSISVKIRQKDRERVAERLNSFENIRAYLKN